MKIGYARVSSVSQQLDAQIKALEEEGCEKIFLEKVSGKNMERPELLNMIDFAREGDVVVIRDTTRLGRNTVDLFDIINKLKSKGVSVKSLKESWLDTTTPQGEFMFTVMAGMAQFERAMSKERQAEGIAIAKEQGKYKGRKKIELNDKFITAYKRFYNREIGVLEAMKEAGIKSRTTWYKLVDEYKKANQENTEKQPTIQEQQGGADGEGLKSFASKYGKKKTTKTSENKIKDKIKKELGVAVDDVQELKIEDSAVELTYTFMYSGKKYQVSYLKNLKEIEFAEILGLDLD